MTIKEFSQRLNLSTATVSRAFTPGARIHPDTRTHILEQARLLGYAPNPSARSLAQKRSRLIGIDYPGNPDVLADLYLVELARGVQTAVQRADYGLLFNTLPRPGGDIELLREWVFGRAVDGVVIVIGPDFSVETLATLAERDVPCVVIRPGPLPAMLPLPTVVIDLAEGAQTAMTHLRRLGHERIGFLSSTPNDAVQTLYTEFLKAEELYDPRLVIATASTIAEGRAAMHRLLAAPQRPSAVFCRTDVLALGALRAVRDMGLRVPEDISLIGHDDIVLVELSDPALTTLRIDTARIGQLAAQMLLDAFADSGHAAPPSNETPRVVTVGTELIVRASTGPVTHAITLSHSSYIQTRVPT
jgi:DNA-binding LacI/PurR family transcriptional regulator